MFPTLNTSDTQTTSAATGNAVNSSVKTAVTMRMRIGVRRRMRTRSSRCRLRREAGMMLDERYDGEEREEGGDVERCELGSGEELKMTERGW